MKYIVRSVLERKAYVDEMMRSIPSLINIQDNNRNAMTTFLRALEAAGNDSCIHLEDDALLADGFVIKAESIVAKHPNMPIQFFSMRGADLTIGTRVEPGRTFLAAVCFYLPSGMSKEILEYHNNWRRLEEHPTGLDLMVADYFQDNKIKYVISIPNLADHRIGKSAINPRRSSKRVSKTFGGRI